MIKQILSFLIAFVFAFLSLTGCKGLPETPTTTLSPETTNAQIEAPTDNYEQITSEQLTSTIPEASSEKFELNNIPKFSNEPYFVVNNNSPYFTNEELTTISFEYYSPLDSLGRCGETYACIGKDIMPTEERGEIGQVKPTGWHTVKYDVVDGKYLYNRCHLIGFQLTGENANNRNLITGTRYMNVDGMLPFENMVADYVKETNNHVLYRVTPIFEDNNLVANGVLMEAFSVEDNGAGICFNVFCYNAQPLVRIDYLTGESYLLITESNESTTQNANDSNEKYILNTNSKKFHKPSCSSVDDMNPKNKQEFNGTKNDLILDGYSPCGFCKP